MSRSQVLAAWLTAAGLLLASIAASWAVIAAAPPAFHGAAIAVIGSSQTRYAVPRDGIGATSFAEDGRRFWRYGVSAISESETVDLANRALDEGAGLIIIEVNALIFDNNSTAARGRCEQPARRQRIALKERQYQITSAWMHLLGREARLDGGEEPTNLDKPGAIDPTKVRDQIPSHLRGPCDRAALLRLGERARRLGSRLVLMAPPRSATTDRLLGINMTRAIDRMAAELANDLRAPLFAPGGAWSDEYFATVGHLDRAGRARFLGELRTFLRKAA